MKYDVIIIGWGKAGKTLAKTFSADGKTVAVIERDEKMAGGTCINVACIPTKTLSVDSVKGADYVDAFERRNLVVKKLNETNYQNLATEETIDIYFGEASFKNDRELIVRAGEERFSLKGALVFINTGSESRIPNIRGIMESKHVYDSTQLQELPFLPKRLGIIGAGNIGLEFASIYSGFGSKVTLIETGAEILKHEEPEIRIAVQEELVQQGIEVLTETAVSSIQDVTNDGVKVITKAGDTFNFDAILIATGRKPAIESLRLWNTAIKLNESGGIWTNDYLRTTVDHVFALGDVRGEEQFTYTSLDDARIIDSYLYGNQDYNLKSRKNLPYSIFINPPFARVGMTEAEALAANLDIRTNILPVAKMPRAHVTGDLRGVFKAVIAKHSNQILGASLFGAQAHEIINIVKLAKDYNLPASVLHNQVFTHPTMAENLNDLFK